MGNVEKMDLIYWNYYKSSQIDKTNDLEIFANWALKIRWWEHVLGMIRTP